MATAGKLLRIRVNRTERMLTVIGVPDVPGVAAGLFSALAEAQIPVTMIVQNAPDSGSASITFTIQSRDAEAALGIAREKARSLGAEGLMEDEEIARITLAGNGLEQAVGVAANLFRELAASEINVLAINATTDRISCIVQDRAADNAVDLLCQRFQLSLED